MTACNGQPPAIWSSLDWGDESSSWTSPAYLIRGILRRGLPILTGLSATYLYRAKRDYGPEDTPDDIRGLPAGHFVVIAGYNWHQRTLLVADPYQPSPYGPAHEYWISMDRVVAAVLLGIVTHDANLLVIYPPPAKLPPTE